MEITQEFRQKVSKALLEKRSLFGGTDGEFAKSYGFSGPIFSRIKKGETERILSDTLWLQIGRKLEVSLKKYTWNTVRTAIYSAIEEMLLECQVKQSSFILAEDCGIGKTHSAKHIANRMHNTFYVDCSQAKTKQLLVRTIAKTVGLDSTGRYIDVKENLKYYINQLETPVIILDEFGDLEYSSFLEIKELWNGTECGWLAMGAQGLRAKMDNGILRQKVGFHEIFDRFSSGYVELIPTDPAQNKQYFQELLTQVATANCANKSAIPSIVKRCLDKGQKLRTLNTLLKFTQ
ncbi:MAG TPA: ATP-binding protein [Moheibacter sp.]|nr:ATP-binding protein [Moheibacter sp.]